MVRPQPTFAALVSGTDCFYFDTPAYERLIRRTFAPHELPSLIEAVFSSEDVSEAVRCLPGDEFQIFIDVTAEARFTFACCRELVN